MRSAYGAISRTLPQFSPLTRVRWRYDNPSIEQVDQKTMNLRAETETILMLCRINRDHSRYESLSAPAIVCSAPLSCYVSMFPETRRSLRAHRYIAQGARHLHSSTLDLLTETSDTAAMDKSHGHRSTSANCSTRNGILFVGRIFQGTYVFTDAFIGAV